MFTADNEHIFTVTLDFLSVQACKNAILSLANVAWYMLHAVQSRSSACMQSGSAGTILLQLLLLKLCIHCISISAN